MTLCGPYQRFNEAEAFTPRIDGKISPTLPAHGRFNEAEAFTPRIAFFAALSQFRGRVASMRPRLLHLG